MICISCAFGHISEFWPQMTFFDPIRWPRMTSRCTKMNSGENFQSNDMYILCIWPCFKFLTSKCPFWPLKWPRLTSDDLIWLHNRDQNQKCYLLICIYSVFRHLQKYSKKVAIFDHLANFCQGTFWQTVRWCS